MVYLVARLRLNCWACLHFCNSGSKSLNVKEELQLWNSCTLKKEYIYIYIINIKAALICPEICPEGVWREIFLTHLLFLSEVKADVKVYLRQKTMSHLQSSQNSTISSISIWSQAQDQHYDLKLMIWDQTHSHMASELPTGVLFRNLVNSRFFIVRFQTKAQFFKGKNVPR